MQDKKSIDRRMNLTLPLSLLASLLCLHHAFAQNGATPLRLDLGKWKSYTTMSNARAASWSNDSLWSATEGGLLLYIASSNRYVKYTNSDGLSTNDLTALTIDRLGRIWIGSSDGYLNMLNPKTGEWKEFTGIKDSPKIQKAVRTLSTSGDTVFVGTDFGIVLFLMNRSEFGDTYSSFGFSTQTRVHEILVVRDRLWAATDFGVISAMRHEGNLSSPSSWKRYESAGIQSLQSAKALCLFRDTLLVGTNSGVAYFNGSVFLPLTAFDGSTIIDLDAGAGDVTALQTSSTNFIIKRIQRVFGPMVIVASNETSGAAGLALHRPKNELWISTSSFGMMQWSGTGWISFLPNGPRSNLFSTMAIDPAGVVWTATGSSTRGQGFYRFNPALPEGSRWKNFSVDQYPLMHNNDYYRISIAGNSVWASAWGYGAVELSGDSIVRRLDETTTPALAGITGYPSYVVVGGAAQDSKGHTWLVNRGAVNGNHLLEFLDAQTVIYRSAIGSGILHGVVIDGNGTKWFTNAETYVKHSTEGLIFFNEGKIISGTENTNGWGVLRKEDGLLPAVGASNVIISLAVDLEGDLWVGTDAGLVVIREPRAPRATNSTTAIFSFANQVIQAIAVDAVNNKWIGTKEGIVVVNQDATQILGQYTVSNTQGKLLDNDVRSIVIDQKRGIIYFGTEKGLSSLEIAPVATERSFSTLDLGPNPFLLPALQPLSIRNLMAETSIKILAVDGTLVREFRAQGGGRAYWDGRDVRGEYVSSGIYYIVAYAENGNEVTTGKVAVVRK
ncbi:MAG: hypothetical protein V1799_09880 [bacterium]